MKFTIGIPAFKSKYLRACIDSVLAQTWTDFEIVIVNDASPHDVDSIIGSYNSSKIRYYKNDVNIGGLHVTDNWNKCLSLASGEYFVLMGDDDEMDRRYLEGFNTLIEKHPDCSVYHCRTIIIDENSRPVRITDPRPETESVYDCVLERMKGSRVFFVSDYLYRTDKLRQAGGYYKLPLAWASDDITAYIAAKDRGIAHTNEPLFRYRESGITLSSTGNIGFKMDAIMLEEAWLKAFVEHEPPNELDKLLLTSIRKGLRAYIQKKKIRTIYSSGDGAMAVLLKWTRLRTKYELSIKEVAYAALMTVKERHKGAYAE